MSAMTAVIDFIFTADAICTACSLMIVWAIIGGPMRTMKFRYKMFMLLVAASLLGATLDKVLTLDELRRNADPDNASVRLFARAMIATARCMMFVSGCYILACWHVHCNRIKQRITARNNNTRYKPTVHLYAKRA